MTIRWHQLTAKALGGSPFALNVRLRQRHTARAQPRNREVIGQRPMPHPDRVFEQDGSGAAADRAARPTPS